MPTITSITPATFDSGRSVTLAGSGFGASEGTVSIGGVSQTVTAWSDSSITFTTSRGSQSMGACRVDVVRPTGGSDGVGYVYWSGSYTPLYDIPATIYVATTGNDSNAGTSGSPYATLNKALSVATAGSVIQLAAGTYTEDRATLGYSSVSFPGPIAASWALTSSGTSGQPIIIRAASGASVILDGASTRAGIHIQRNDYVYIAGLEIQNVRFCGIGCTGDYNTTNSIIDRTAVSSNCVIENCNIHAVRFTLNENVQGIANWGSSYWTIRNNTISDVEDDGGARGAGIRAYCTEQCIVEHNEITITGSLSNGIHWKDHWVEDVGGTPVTESEIRYNRISAVYAGVLVGIRGSGYARAGENYIHHNIIRGMTNVDGGGVAALMASSDDQASGLIRVEHNIMDGQSNANAIGAGFRCFNDIRLVGNIFAGVPQASIAFENDEPYVATRPTIMTDCDYNIFPATGFVAKLDRYNASGTDVTSLATFEALASGAYVCIGADVKDTNDQQNSSSLFTDAAAQDYSYKVGSLALAFMGDGSNAGPYQLGTETIGNV
jgi:hypothetical protein